MKEQYESRTRYMLPRRTYTLIRVDGRAFHTYTRGLERPYSKPLMACMDEAALALCAQCSGAAFAFIQSDEISVLLTDFNKIDTAAWFDGNVQKLCSITASITTAAFNRAVLARMPDFNGMLGANAQFDSRAWTIPDPVEVANYFIWRQKDAVRNSVTMLAQAYASAKQLHGKDRAAQHDIIHEAGDNWNNHPPSFKRGRAVVYKDMRWMIDEDTPEFTKDKEYLTAKIPVQWPADVPNEQSEIDKFVDERINAAVNMLHDRFGIPRPGRKPDFVNGRFCIRCNNSLPEGTTVPCDVCGAPTVLDADFSGLVSESCDNKPFYGGIRRADIQVDTEDVPN